MNKFDLIFKYAKGKKLNKEELRFLENYLATLIEETRLSDSRPKMASNEMCDSLGLCHESFEMSCIASILDKCQPLENEISREQKVFYLLLQSRFLYY